MINGTKLLNVAGMTRGRRDGILKSEKTRHVVKIGPMITNDGFRFRPYVLLGCGYYHLYSNSGTLYASGTTTGGFQLNSLPAPAPSISDSYFGAQGGVGIDVPVTARLNAGISAQFHQILEPGRDDKFFIPSLYLDYLF